MKKPLLAAAAVVTLFSAPASADGLSPFKFPFFDHGTPAYGWNGLYVGTNLGYIGATSNSISSTGTNLYAAPGTGGVGSAVAASATGSVPLAGAAGGLIGTTLGYNLQYQSFVIGVEGDADTVLNGQQGKVSVLGTVPGSGVASSGVITAYRSLDSIGTVRGRAGFLIQPNLLIYGTGGLAVGDVELGTNVAENPGSFGTSYSGSQFRTGWVAGGGGEWRLAQGWSVKVEYLRYDLGTESLYATFPQYSASGALQTMTGVTTSSRFNGNLVRFGINTRFDLSSLKLPFIH